MLTLDTVNNRRRIEGATIPSAYIPETPSAILYENASSSVADRMATKVRLLRKYAAYLIETDNQGTVTGFHARLEESKEKDAWIPDVRTLQLWVAEQKLSPNDEIRLPQKRGPKGPRIDTAGDCLEIMRDLMAQTYPTTAAKKKPRKVPFGGEYIKLVKICKKNGITSIPSKSTMRQRYAGISPLEKNANKLSPEDLESKYGVRSTNPIFEDFRVQLDYQHLKYFEIKRGQKTFKLQLAVAVEMNTGCILSPSLFEGSLNGNKLRSIIYNTLTAGSEPDAPSFLQLDLLQIDGESPNRSLEKSQNMLCGMGIEIGFPDCYKRERRRSAAEKAEWEFENLCNVAASEFLFPLEDFTADMGTSVLTGGRIKELAARYEASIDATAIRYVSLCKTPATVVFVEYREPEKGKVVSLFVQYSMPNSSFSLPIRKGCKINSKSIANRALREQKPLSALSENWMLHGSWSRFRVEAIPLPKFQSKVTADLAIVLYPI